MPQPPSTRKYSLLGLIFFLVIALVVFASLFAPKFFPTEYVLNGASTATAPVKLAQTEPVLKPASTFVVTHVATPKPMRAIYMSACIAGSKKLRENLVAIADTTEVNSIVIDIKDYSGRISFQSDNPLLKPVISETCRADDMKEFIGLLHSKNIYVIGRITVFQDPYMTKMYPDRAVHTKSDGGVWKDFKGLSFIDVGSKEHWDYIVALAKESYRIGFDELNFDYIRYPSDGNMKDTAYKLEPGEVKSEKLRQFFQYLHDQLKPTGVMMSADLFGMTTTNTDDLNIGQVLENALPNFDFVDPMVYPSHYPPNFHGYPDPNKNPYGVVYFSMSTAVNRARALDEALASSTPGYVGNSVEKLRPWLQDFQYGGTYGVPEIRAQIKATYDSGLDSWLLWNPANKYNLGALDKESPCVVACGSEKQAL